MSLKEDLEHARAALRGDDDLDETVLARLIDSVETAEAARIDAIVESAALLNERATLLEAANQPQQAAGFLRGTHALLKLAGFESWPCPHCGEEKVHPESCPIFKAVSRWRMMLVPGKAVIRS